MSNIDFFISYKSEDEDLAKKCLSYIEEKGLSCFFAPRDIKVSTRYPEVLLNSIENSDSVLFIYTEHSNKSPHVAAELNAAFSRNIPIFPLKFGNIAEMDPNIKYFLSFSQIRNADDNLKAILDEVISVKKDQHEALKSAPKQEIKVSGKEVLSVRELLDKKFDAKTLAMREMEIDYLVMDKYEKNEETVGSIEEWANCIEHIEQDTSACLIRDDFVIGYCDLYPVNDQAYDEIQTGKQSIRSDMNEITGFGGTFKAVCDLMIVPKEDDVDSNFKLIDWLFKHMADLKKQKVIISEIEFTAYSELGEKMFKIIGFEHNGLLDPSGAKIYTITREKLLNSQAVKNRYERLDL